MEDLIASEEDLHKFNSAAEDEKHVTPALRGVLVELATSGVNRYPWPLLRPLVYHQLDSVLTELDNKSRVEIGPAPPLPGGNTLESIRTRLHAELDAFTDAAPFTLQRLAELLLEPEKQYTRLGKLALALERLLLVTSTAALTNDPPPRPRLSSLRPVNENPPSPGAPPARRPDVGPALANGVVREGAAGFGLTGALFRTEGQAQPEADEANNASPTPAASSNPTASPTNPEGTATENGPAGPSAPESPGDTGETPEGGATAMEVVAEGSSGQATPPSGPPEEEGVGEGGPSGVDTPMEAEAVEAGEAVVADPMDTTA